MTYSLYKITIQTEIKRNMVFLKRIQIYFLRIKNLSFPFLFISPKFHKISIKYKFISDNINGSGREFNRKFEKLLKKILNVLKLKYKNYNMYCIIMNSYEIRNDWIKKDILNIHTYDLKNRFTNILITWLKDSQ